MFKLFAVGALALTLISCSSIQTTRDQREARPLPGPNQALQKNLQEAKALYNKNPSEGVASLAALAKDNPQTPEGLEAHKLLGDHYLKNENQRQALYHYNVILKNDFLEPFEAHVCIHTVSILKDLNQPQQALETLNRTLSFSSLKYEDRILLLNTRLELQRGYNDLLGQLETLGTLYSISQDVNEKESYRARASSLTDVAINSQDLNTILSNSRLRFIHPAIRLRLGLMELDRSNFKQAREHLNQVLSLDPNGEFAEVAQEHLHQIDARFSVSPRSIGVILPLSGRHAQVGRNILSALQLGLGIYDNKSPFKLSIIDSEGRSLDARKAVEKLVVEDKVIAIVGSLQSKSAATVASKAQSLGVPTFVLSQKSGLTDIGPYVFRSALTSEMQVDHLVQVATTKLGLSKFAILYPEDPYGLEYANLFWSAVEKHGGSIRAAQSYNPKETDFRSSIQKIVGTFYHEDRSEEYKERLTEWENKNLKRSARTEIPKDLLPPLVDFDAIFIPDSTRAMGQISAMLSANDIKNIKLLGTNLWSSSDLLGRMGAFTPIFTDSFLKQDPQFLSSPVVKEFQEKLGRVPSFFDIQAYDISIALRSVLRPSSSRASLKESLSQLQIPQGSLTELRMLPSRDLSRPIVTLTVQDGHVVLLQ